VIENSIVVIVKNVPV